MIFCIIFAEFIFSGGRFPRLFDEYADAYGGLMGGLTSIRMCKRGRLRASAAKAAEWEDSWNGRDQPGDVIAARMTDIDH